MAIIVSKFSPTPTNNIGWFLYSIKYSLVNDAGWKLKGTGNGSGGLFSNVATAGSSTATDHFVDETVAATNGAWFRVRTPTTLSNGTYRELTFQALRYNTTDNGSGYHIDWGAGGAIRIKYSLCISGSGFYNGAISANSGTTPSAEVASDEYIVVGANVGKDTGSFNNILELAGARMVSQYWDSTSFYWNMVANTSAPYNFCMFTYRKTSLDQVTLFSFHDMLSGSYDNSDQDPYVFSTHGFYSFGSYFGFNVHKAILGYGTVNQKMVELSKQNPISPGQGHIAAEDNLIPSRFYRLESATSPYGWKGLSTFMMDLSTWASRNTTDTLSVNTSKDKIYLGDFVTPNSICVLPWDGTTPSI